MELRERIEELLKGEKFLYLESIEYLLSYTNKMCYLNSYRLPSDVNVEIETKTGNEKYYQNVLESKEILSLKFPNPEYEIKFPDCFIENKLILKYGYRIPKIDVLEEIIEGFHLRKRFIIARWFLTIDPTPDLSAIYILYPIEFIYPMDFWKEETDREFWKKVYKENEVIRFSNI